MNEQTLATLVTLGALAAFALIVGAALVSMLANVVGIFGNLT